MYHTFFGMKRKPFQNSVDLNVLYLAPQHEMAWDFVIQGLRSGEQYSMVLGEYGIGKSTLVARLIQALEKNSKLQYRVVPNPNYSYGAILRMIAAVFLPEEALGGDDLQQLEDRLIEHFEGSHTIKPVYVIFDDVHEADAIALLPKILSFSKITVQRVPVIRWILFGHVSFKRTLQAAGLQALDQRIRHRCIMEPLSPMHSKEYIYFRMARSGAMGVPRFQPDAMQRIYEYSKGLPRLINNACDMILQTGAAMNSTVIDLATVEKALNVAEINNGSRVLDLGPRNSEGEGGEKGEKADPQRSEEEERKREGIVELNPAILMTKEEEPAEEKADIKAGKGNKGNSSSRMGIVISMGLCGIIALMLIVIALKLYQVF